MAQPNSASHSMALLAAIVESSDDAILSKDLEGRVISWNKGAERMLGFSAAEVLGRPVTDTIIPDARREEEKTILAAIARGERLEHYETVRCHKDGRHIEVSVSISPVVISGKVIGASTIARDISAQKQAARELKEMRDALERHAQELEREVARRTQQLSDAVANLETFSYSLSHDMRAPLRAVKGFVDLVLEENGDALSQESRDLLSRAAAAAKRLAAFVEETLESARSRSMPARLLPVSLSTLVPFVIETYPNLGERRQAIEVRQPLDSVMGTEPLLTQCVSNLLGNALKFASPDRPARVEVWTRRHGDKVRLHVRDNGIGIPEDEQAKIFDLFSRGANSVAAEGAGVGLAVVKRAADRMRGQIGLASKPGAGADFWLELPAA